MNLTWNTKLEVALFWPSKNLYRQWCVEVRVCQIHNNCYVSKIRLLNFFFYPLKQLHSNTIKGVWNVPEGFSKHCTLTSMFKLNIRNKILNVPSAERNLCGRTKWLPTFRRIINLTECKSWWISAPKPGKNEK